MDFADSPEHAEFRREFRQWLDANLTDDLLLRQSKRILNRLVPGGTLIVAGILKSQFARVRRVYKSAGLRLLATGHDDEWQSGAFGW